MNITDIHMYICNCKVKPSPPSLCWLHNAVGSLLCRTRQELIFSCSFHSCSFPVLSLSWWWKPQPLIYFPEGSQPSHTFLSPPKTHVVLDTLVWSKYPFIRELPQKIFWTFLSYEAGSVWQLWPLRLYGLRCHRIIDSFRLEKTHNWGFGVGGGDGQGRAEWPSNVSWSEPLIMLNNVHYLYLNNKKFSKKIFWALPQRRCHSNVLQTPRHAFPQNLQPSSWQTGARELSTVCKANSN